MKNNINDNDIITKNVRKYVNCLPNKYPVQEGNLRRYFQTKNQMRKKIYKNKVKYLTTYIPHLHVKGMANIIQLMGFKRVAARACVVLRLLHLTVGTGGVA